MDLNVGAGPSLPIPQNSSQYFPQYDFGTRGLGWQFRVIVSNECPWDLVRTSGPHSLGDIIKANSGYSGQFIWIPEKHWPNGTFAYALNGLDKPFEVQFYWDQKTPEKSTFKVAGGIPPGVAVASEVRGDCVHFFVTDSIKIEKRREELQKAGKQVTYGHISFDELLKGKNSPADADIDIDSPNQSMPAEFYPKFDE
ncbi:hypothetical protein AA313_de0200709 [Arthrobotrys entomopaga]|nr:hypothetical protein AA313_de0200709 [Arthrobotrys entomopaga]